MDAPANVTLTASKRPRNRMSIFLRTCDSLRGVGGTEAYSGNRALSGTELMSLKVDECHTANVHLQVQILPVLWGNAQEVGGVETPVDNLKIHSPREPACPHVNRPLLSMYAH